MKKTARQETFSISQPLRTGPAAPVIAVKPDHVPMACPRSSLLKEADDREAARYEQCGADPLNRTSSDELRDVRRQSAPNGS